MKRKETKPLSKHTLLLFDYQMEALQELHPRLGAAKVIRTLVDDHIRSAKEGAMKKLDLSEVPELKIEEILP